MTRLGQLLRRRPPSTGQGSRPDGSDHWQTLTNPVPGFTTIDGLPVPVVVVRRRTGTAQLEVVRGYHPTAEWPRAGVPPGTKRHLIPAASFSPHPRRERIIGDERFQLNTLPASLRCRECGKDDLGFGFVSSAIRTAEAEPSPTHDRTLCEACADRLSEAPR